MPLQPQRPQKELYDITVDVGTLEESLFSDGTFDAITLWDVIEHIRRPVANIRVASRLLRPEGILVMKTPNEASLFKLIARTVYRLFGRSGNILLKYVYYIPHYFSYSPQTMNLLLQRFGFEILDYEMDEIPLKFSEEKINIYYKKDSMHKAVIAFLPAVQFLARLLRRTNKMAVYARKI